MMVILRKAHKNEINILWEFEKAIIDFEREFNDDLKDTKFHYYNIPDLIDSPTAEVIVAIVDEEIVGSGYAKLKEAKSYENKEQYGHLGFMFVRPEHRRKGINNKIMMRLMAWVKEQGVNEVMLDVYADNAAAVNAYIKTGFKSKLIKMNMKI